MPQRDRGGKKTQERDRSPVYVHCVTVKKKLLTSYASSGTSHVTLKHNCIFNCAGTFVLNAYFTVVSFSPDPTKTLPQFQHLFPCSLGDLTDAIDVLPRWWLWQSTISNIMVRLRM